MNGNFCTSCGMKLNREWKYCNSCGSAALSNSSTSEVSTNDFRPILEDLDSEVSSKEIMANHPYATGAIFGLSALFVIILVIVINLPAREIPDFKTPPSSNLTTSNTTSVTEPPKATGHWEKNCIKVRVPHPSSPGIDTFQEQCDQVYVQD